MTRVLLIIDDYNEMIYLQTLLKKLGFDAEAIGNTRVFSETMLGFNPSVVVMTAHGKKINGIKLSKSINKYRGVPAIVLLRSAGQVFAEGEFDEGQIDMMIESPVNILNLVKGLCDLSGQSFEPISEKLAKVLRSDPEAKNKGIVKELSSLSDSNADTRNSDLIRIKGSDHESDGFDIFSDGVPEKEEVQIIKGEETSSSGPSLVKSEVQSAHENKKGNSKVARPETTLGWEDRQKKYDDYLAKANKDLDTKVVFPRDKIKSYNRKHRKSERTESMEKLDEQKKKFVNAMYSHLKSS